MNKIIVTLATAGILGIGSIGVSIATNWVTNVNTDRREHHDAIRELQIRSEYLNGSVPSAPVNKLKK